MSLYKNHLNSLKSKLIFNVIIIHAVLMTFVVFDLTQREHLFMQKQLSTKGFELSSILASNASTALLNNDLVALDELLLDMDIIKDHHTIFILDKNGKVRASTNKEYLNKYLYDNVSQEIFNELVDANLVKYQITHDNLIDTMHEVKVNDNIVGYTRTLLDQRSILEEMDIITKTGLFYIFAAIVIGAFFSWLAVRRVTDRLNNVAKVAENISNKNFDVELPDSAHDDEVSKMTKAFNIMIKSIKGYISEIESSNKKIKDSEIKLLEAQAISHIGSWELDVKTLTMKWSPELYRIYHKDESTYDPALDNFLLNLDDEDKEKINTSFINILQSGERTQLQIKYNVNDETAVYTDITAMAVYNEDGNIYKLVGTIQDVTQHVEDEEKLKLREKQLLVQSRLAQMGEMIAMIAHQWRQPLAAISATSMDLQVKSQLKHYDLAKEDDAIKYEEYVNKSILKIDSFVHNLTGTIDDFRNFYKPNKQSTIIKLEDVVLKSLDIIKASLENDKINIILESNSGIDLEIYSNEVMQVVLNLLKNAQDNFNEKDIEKPYIKIIIQDKSISVCDNGGGIPENIIENIFDPYFSTKDEKNGTGLGLYMSKIIIEDHHNGRLSVNNLDNGVCFTIELGTI